MTYKIHPVILCGGSGTRLWPLSTPETPKQFLALTSSQSMIEETAARFGTTEREDLDFESILVVGSKRHADLLSAKLPDAQKILEPMGRNSAPAVAAACLARAPDDLILILPADHNIRDVPAFHDAIAVAAVAAEAGILATFGIEPTHPATGYGYIKSRSAGFGRVLDVESFVEKPDLATAKAYLASGSYYWNAGIFLFKASAMLQALEKFAPAVLQSVGRAMVNAESDMRLDLDPDLFAETPSISIDYAVMEKAQNVKTVPVNMGWSDVGGYRALHELMTSKNTENLKHGPVIIKNSEGLYVRSEGPVVSVNGVSNLVIVATENEVMITPKHDDAAVKTLGSEVQSGRYALGLSRESLANVKTWLWEALTHWSTVGWDAQHGGFVEQLKMDGSADTDAPRRVRVQARQIYSFSKAIEMGWPETDKARELIDQGISYINSRLTHPDGGFVHLIDADGSVIDKRRDLYDHAFMILAGSAAYKTTGSPKALKVADEALSYVNSHLKDTVHGGWFESSQLEQPRRANPHMHMLEAMLQYHSATGSLAALDHANEIVRLFETKFFNPATDTMAEFFNNDWSPLTDDQNVVWEPGHHYEWATLLYQFEQVTGHDSRSWRRRLNRKADQFGINKETKFPANKLKASGSVIDSNSRLWHQLERIRAYLNHPLDYSRTECDALIQHTFTHYLKRGPVGGWIDEVGRCGEQISNNVPASMLYHAVTAFAKLV
ncbi:MAG: AGE family epimerase/isomerase [Pseudomonadota bacterium]